MSSDPYKNPGTKRKYSAKTRIPSFPKKKRPYTPFGGPHTRIAARPKGMQVPSIAKNPVLAERHAKTSKALEALAQKGTRFTAAERQAIRGVASRPRYAAKGGFITKGPNR